MGSPCLAGNVLGLKVTRMPVIRLHFERPTAHLKKLEGTQCVSADMGKSHRRSRRAGGVGVGVRLPAFANLARSKTQLRVTLLLTLPL